GTRGRRAPRAVLPLQVRARRGVIRWKVLQFDWISRGESEHRRVDGLARRERSAAMVVHSSVRKNRCVSDRRAPHYQAETQETQMYLSRRSWRRRTLRPCRPEEGMPTPEPVRVTERVERGTNVVSCQSCNEPQGFLLHVPREWSRCVRSKA